jgi:hypothetical protein
VIIWNTVWEADMAVNRTRGSKQPGDESESSLIRSISGAVDDVSLQNSLVLWGYLKNLNDRYWRLYLTPEFDEYVDIQKSAGEGSGDYVHHVHATTSSTDSPLAGTYVWVKRNARLLHTKARPSEELARFLQGDITLDYLPQTGPEATLDTAEVVGERQRRRDPAVRISFLRGLRGCGSVGPFCESYQRTSCEL